MPNISEIARNLGYSRQYVQRCVHQGCPTDTFENARLWFGAHRQKASKKLSAQSSPLSPEELAHHYTGKTESSTRHFEADSCRHCL
jgi:hypothetical protein